MRRASSRFMFVAGVLLAAAPVEGSAQPAGPSDLMTPYGEYILLGAGATDFTKKEQRDAYDVGWTWAARLGIGSRRNVGLEAAYVGSIRNGKSNGPDLLANGAEAVIRLQYPWAAGTLLAEPFVFGGIGFSHLSLRNAPALLPSTTDNIGGVPIGAGVTVGLGRFLLDGRFTYRATFNEDLGSVPGVSSTRPDLKQWAVDAAIGWEF